VANLSYKTSWQTLKDCMRDVGTVVYANVMRDDSGAPACLLLLTLPACPAGKPRPGAPAHTLRRAPADGRSMSAPAPARMFFWALHIGYRSDRR